MNRKKGESYLSYARRLTAAVDDNVIDYDAYGDLLLGADNVYSSENIRKFFYGFKKFLERLDESIDITDEAMIEQLDLIKFETLKERKKLQRINQEYYENARLSADKELYNEMVKESISNLKPIKIVPSTIKSVNHKTTGLLVISDAHYGKEVSLKGLDGEVINAYSTEIFKARMWKLLSDLDSDLYSMDIDKLEITDCGDNVEGILRCTNTLRKLKTGVIDSAMEYGEFMATWICEVYNRLQIPITYSLTGGNHDIIRMLSSKKDFDDENISKTIHSEIANRIEISCLKTQIDTGIKPQITIAPYNDMIYKNIYGMNIMAYHGDSKNLKEDMSFFENYYGIDIDMLITGHLHRSSQETVGFGYLGDKEIIRVPSIIGGDDFAKSIRRMSRAGAKFFTFDENGKNWEKTYFLS
jgi:hypothetical protein